MLETVMELRWVEVEGEVNKTVGKKHWPVYRKEAVVNLHGSILAWVVSEKLYFWHILHTSLFLCSELRLNTLHEKAALNCDICT